MNKRVLLVVVTLISICLNTHTSATDYDILRPCGINTDYDVKKIGPGQRKMMVPHHRSRKRSNGFSGSNGIIDTLTWRSKGEPDVNFGFLTPGDSLLVWFQPPAPCSLIAIRFYPVNWEGSTLIDVWNAGRYEPHILSPDSVDSNGWIGTFDPITDPSNWISGMWDHSPLGGSALDPKHHYWGPFPYTVTSAHSEIWVEVPARYGLQGEIDLGSDPFYISHTYYICSGWGFGSEYPWTTPYNLFKFFSAGTGPDGAHNGWFIRSYFMWYEAVVKYYGNTPPSIKSLKVQSDTYNPGPIPITVTITDNDAEDETRAGVASAELVYVINGVVDSVAMDGPPEGGGFTANIPELAVGDVVTYWVEATDPTGLFSRSKKMTFTRITPRHPSADMLIIWDSFYAEAMYTFLVDAFTTMDFELWHLSQRDGIDASVINWGWKTIYVSGWECRHTLPGRDYAGNLFAEWLESGTTDEPHNLLYCDQDYFCAHPEYDCDWDGELIEGDFLHDYFGVAAVISNNYGASYGGYDSIAIGLGDFEDIRVNFMPDAWDPTSPQYNLWPDWIIDLTEEAEYILRYAHPPVGTGFGAGIRLDGGHYKTVYLPWQDFFSVDLLENGDLVPRPDLVEMYERILEWFGTASSTGETLESELTLTDFALRQNYPNPFNTTTDIRYEISDTKQAVHTTLKIFNILGEEVRTLVDEFQEIGSHVVTWDGRDTDGTELGSGVYFYQLTAGVHFVQTRKMILLK